MTHREFAVRSIADWWKHMGKRAYPDAKERLITADSRREQRRELALVERAPQLLRPRSTSSRRVGLVSDTAVRYHSWGLA